MKSWLGDNPTNAILLGGCSMLPASLSVGLVSKDVDQAGTVESAPVAAAW